jgi:hypothetical protein
VWHSAIIFWPFMKNFLASFLSIKLFFKSWLCGYPINRESLPCDYANKHHEKKIKNGACLNSYRFNKNIPEHY